MSDILQEIARYTQGRIANKREFIPKTSMMDKALAVNPDTGFPFEQALRKEGLSYICEVKKASPSKGVIAENYPYVEIAKSYEEAGASAISVLTEPKYFLGKDEHLEEVKKNVSIPVLRKDFVVDDYMIYEAKTLGADAVLLIAAILEPHILMAYINICSSLGLTALVEAHNEEEVIKALQAGARVVGINSRNLRDFSIDLDGVKKLYQMVPPDVILVSESGIKTAEDIEKIRELKADAILIGETMMRAEDKTAKLKELKGED